MSHSVSYSSRKWKRDELQQRHLPQPEEIIENKLDNSMETNQGYITAVSDDQNNLSDETKELTSKDGREKHDPISDAENVGEESKKEKQVGFWGRISVFGG